MMGFWDKIECDQDVFIVLKSGNTATEKCEGVLLPMKRTDESQTTIIHLEFWKCSRCGREVK